MNAGGKVDKQLQELNHRLQDGGNEDGVGGQQQDLVDDDKFNNNNIAKDVKDGCGEAVQASAVQPVLQTSQQQPQGTTVCWERFLNLRSLKILLVENDDSTRHIVAALLRNCSYEVTEASNGLQAWKILEDLTNHIDLVLTEVVMPCLSGIALLSRIMSHKIRKNLPVIMMSSLDSMSLVFKCLSKGAVDFLVKPVRKNELKNLWQHHIWRRCHSSSWTKQAIVVDSPKPISPCDRVAECPDSTCAQVIHSNADMAGSRRVPVTAAKECQEHEEQCGLYEIFGSAWPCTI